MLPNSTRSTLTHLSSETSSEPDSDAGHLPADSPAVDRNNNRQCKESDDPLDRRNQHQKQRGSGPHWTSGGAWFGQTGTGQQGEGAGRPRSAQATPAASADCQHNDENRCSNAEPTVFRAPPHRTRREPNGRSSVEKDPPSAEFSARQQPCDVRLDDALLARVNQAFLDRR